MARRRWAARAVPAVLSALALALAAGCGDSGVSAGATVSVYLSAPMQGSEGAHGRELCTEAKRALARADSKAGDLRVRLRCLDASGPSGAWTLAAVGANARQAVQDATAVAYIGEPDRQARLQSRPIVEEAGIAEISAGSGSSVMQHILDAVAEADPESLRESVGEALEAGWAGTGNPLSQLLIRAARRAARWSRGLPVPAPSACCSSLPSYRRLRRASLRSGCLNS